jgi:16S rRNA (guanine966-N2)-methyltransferase
VIRFPPAPACGPRPTASRDAVQLARAGLSGKRCLDLYAGSGALTLEAASRGAALAVAVDRDRALVDALRATSARSAQRAIEAIVGDAGPSSRTSAASST